MREIWVPLIGFKKFYEISNLGRIKTLDRVVLSRPRATGVNTRTIKERIRPPEPTRNGYLRITLSKKGINKRYLIHRLVAKHFISNPNGKPCVNHKDGNKHNNKLSNLDWCTYSENEKHSYDVLGKISRNKKQK